MIKRYWQLLTYWKKNNRGKSDCCNVCYVGDGYSDAFAMRFVHNNGGKAIFLSPFNLNDDLCFHNNKIYESLNAEGIIDYYCVTDYRKGSSLSKILK